ncbi:rhodanese-like domain-containing protein [Castellaniella sp.]|uniref:rhodanese-like domain-containing protein n=1 Tax=Castellaniella sp. TaxID=1955812 RepID=UPI0035680190
MDFLLSQNNLWILLIALVSGALLLWPSLSGAGRSNARIALADAIGRINRENGLFVDIRPETQFKAGSIPQARNIPIDTLEAHAGSLPKDRPIVVVDTRGQDASKAVAQLRKHGLEQVFSLEGGLNAWIDGGLPLKKS